mmetsp:Transcript_55829/g.169931  ORF Transcript_55829/g.169931 Transcript_55829/m.169931 type:complete len:213 (+) Transcript_55829:199-837(+)
MHGRKLFFIADPACDGARPLVRVVMTRHEQVDPVLQQQRVQVLGNVFRDLVIAAVILRLVCWPVGSHHHPRELPAVDASKVRVEPCVLGAANRVIVLARKLDDMHIGIRKAVPKHAVPSGRRVREPPINRNAALPVRVVPVIAPSRVEAVARSLRWVLVPPCDVVVLVVPDAHHVRNAGGHRRGLRLPQLPDKADAPSVRQIPEVQYEPRVA